MEVWRHQRSHYHSAKVYCSGFHVKAMSEYADGALGNEELGGCGRGQVLAERVVGPRPAKVPRFRFTSLIEVPLVRVPQGKNLRKTGRVDAEVWN